MEQSDLAWRGWEVGGSKDGIWRAWQPGTEDVYKTASSCQSNPCVCAPFQRYLWCLPQSRMSPCLLFASCISYHYRINSPKNGCWAKDMLLKKKLISVDKLPSRKECQFTSPWQCVRKSIFPHLCYFGSFVKLFILSHMMGENDESLVSSFSGLSD